MLSSGLDNISGFQRDNSTIRMSHKAGDEIGVRKGVGGSVEKLGISLGISRPLAIHVGVSSVVTIALGGQMGGGGSKVVVVGGDNSAVSVGDQLGVSLGGSFTVPVHGIGVSIGVVTIALSGKMGGCGGGIGRVQGGDCAISVVHQWIRLSRPLAVRIGVSIGVGIGLGSQVSGSGGSIGGVIRGDGTIRVVDKLTGGHSH